MNEEQGVRRVCSVFFNHITIISKVFLQQGYSRREQSSRKKRPDLGIDDPKIGTLMNKRNSAMRETFQFQHVANCLNVAYNLQYICSRTYKGGLFYGS